MEPLTVKTKVASIQDKTIVAHPMKEGNKEGEKPGGENGTGPILTKWGK
jgi:hypothetical protein